MGSKLQTDPEKFGPLTIATVRNHNGTLLFSFEGRRDRNSVEELRNTLLLAEVNPDDEAIEEDEFHITQIIGCEVVTSTGLKVGLVKDVLQLPAQDTLVIDRDGVEVLIPFVKKHVPEIDLENHRLTVEEVEGLL